MTKSERDAIIEICARIAEGDANSFDFQDAWAKCEDRDAGFAQARLSIAKEIRALQTTTDKLLLLTEGDIDALQEAIAKAANGGATADLKMVVEHIEKWRAKKSVVPATTLSSKDGTGGAA